MENSFLAANLMLTSGHKNIHGQQCNFFFKKEKENKKICVCVSLGSLVNIYLQPLLAK